MNPESVILPSVVAYVVVWVSCFISLFASGERLRYCLLGATFVPLVVLGGYIVLIIMLGFDLSRK